MSNARIGGVIIYHLKHRRASVAETQLTSIIWDRKYVFTIQLYLEKIYCLYREIKIMSGYDPGLKNIVTSWWKV